MAKLRDSIAKVDQAARVEKMRANPNWIATTSGRFKGGKTRKDGRVEVYWRGRYRPRARVMMEQHLGRVLAPTEHVHHVKGDHTDDRLENLEVKLKGEHTRIHSLDRAARGLSRSRTCEPGCACGRHRPRTRYWSGAKTCEPGCTCGRHRATRPAQAHTSE